MSLSVTLYPSNDTYVKSTESSTNFNTSEHLLSGESDDSSDNYRTFLKFDLSSIPKGSRIVSATFYIYVFSDRADKNATKTLYQITTSWDSSAVTWNAQPTWDTGTAIGSWTHINGAAQATEYSTSFSTTLLQGWLAGTTTNNGVAIISQYGNADMGWYYSTDSVTVGYRPKITITYNPPVRRSMFV